MHFEIERQWNHCPVEFHGTLIFLHIMEHIKLLWENPWKIHYMQNIYIYINIYINIYIYNYIYNYIYESIKMRNSSALRLDGLRWLKEVVSGLFFLCMKKRHVGYQLVYTLTGQYIKIILFKWVKPFYIHSIFSYVWGSVGLLSS